MTMDKWISTALLMIAVVLSVEAKETEVQSNRSVWVGVEVNHNSSDEWCEVPGQPLNGEYRSEGNAVANRYSPGDTITYYCNRGHEVIGQANRTCHGTPNGWQPDEPHCQPEYIGHLMRWLNGIEDQMRAIEQRITTIENNTSQIGNNISVMDKRMTTIDNNVSAIYNMELLNSPIDRQRLVACTDIHKKIDLDTVAKCMTMQMGERNGSSVSVYTWVIPDFNNRVTKEWHRELVSQPFYHTVPGYKFRLIGYYSPVSLIGFHLQLLPGEYDDQLKWPFSETRNDVTVLTKTGLEAPQMTYSGGQSTCQLNRPTSNTEFNCFTKDPNWDYVYLNQKHILSDGSAVVKLYFYN